MCLHDGSLRRFLFPFEIDSQLAGAVAHARDFVAHILRIEQLLDVAQPIGPVRVILTRDRPALAALTLSWLLPLILLILRLPRLLPG